MRISLPGIPGAYYDTDAESTALTAALTAAGRKAPKPQGYAVQLLPVLWSIDVDLQEAPSDHPIQYLHPEGARSLESLSRERQSRVITEGLEYAMQLGWSLNEETEAVLSEALGRERSPDREGIRIEVEDRNGSASNLESETGSGAAGDSDEDRPDTDHAGADESQSDLTEADPDRDDDIDPGQRGIGPD